MSARTKSKETTKSGTLDRIRPPGHETAGARVSPARIPRPAVFGVSPRGHRRNQERPQTPSRADNRVGRRESTGLTSAGPQRVGGLCWDDLAADQSRIYREVLAGEMAGEFDAAGCLDDFAAVVAERGLR
jgi:hypothetical protein